MTFVRTIAERLLSAQTAAANADALAATKAIRLALGINEFKIFAFYAK
jgi:hypothetical protein